MSTTTRICPTCKLSFTMPDDWRPEPKQCAICDAKAEVMNGSDRILGALDDILRERSGDTVSPKLPADLAVDWRRIVGVWRNSKSDRTLLGVVPSAVAGEAAKLAVDLCIFPYTNDRNGAVALRADAARVAFVAISVMWAIDNGRFPR